MGRAVGHGPMQEGEPLEQELSCARNAEVVGPPVLEAVLDKLLEDVKALRGGDVPVAPLLGEGEIEGEGEGEGEGVRKGGDKGCG